MFTKVFRCTLLLVSLVCANGLAFYPSSRLAVNNPYSRQHSERRTRTLSHGASKDDIHTSPTPTIDSAMASNQLMHAMLRVENVNATVEYWVDRGANKQTYRKSAKAETAFVGYGDTPYSPGYFSLEITALPSGESPILGNAVQYFGTSMLLNFDLLSAAAGVKPKAPSQSTDPNGFEVRSVASAPGDPFSRLCLRTTADKIAATAEFYTKILGMEEVAIDGQNVCLRYSSGNDIEEEGGRKGVGTTLVFSTDKDNNDVEIEQGNCFDHFAISTASVEEADKAIRETASKSIFMDPTKMFGTVLIGLTDPNGYKLYLVEEMK